MKTSQERILSGAFHLFLEFNYEKVSTSMLEKKIGLSRGSIFYHSKNKEELFRDVIDKFILAKQDIENRLVLSEFENKTLFDFLNKFVDSVEANIVSMKTLVEDEEKAYGAYFRLIYQAQQYYKGFSEHIFEKFNRERKCFEVVVRNAIEKGEIKSHISPENIAYHLRYIFAGCSFQESLNKGVKIDELRSLILSYYKLIKNGDNE